MTRIGTPPFGRWRRDVRRSRRTCAPDRRHGPLRAQWHARSAATSRRGTARRRKTARRAPSRPRRAPPRCSTTDRRAPRPRASGPRGPRSRHARPRLRVDRELAAAIEARRRRATRSRTPSRARARTLARWENPACAPAANPPGRGPPRPRRDGARARVGFTSRREPFPLSNGPPEVDVHHARRAGVQRRGARGRGQLTIDDLPDEVVGQAQEIVVGRTRLGHVARFYHDGIIGSERAQVSGPSRAPV